MPERKIVPKRTLKVCSCGKSKRRELLSWGKNDSLAKSESTLATGPR